jgi:hypothetical protein
MEPQLASEERQLCNRLTAVKLALQILEQRTPLSDRQRGLARRALEGVDALATTLLERIDAERNRPVSREPLDRTVDARDRRWLSRPRGHRAAAANPRENAC